MNMAAQTNLNSDDAKGGANMGWEKIVWPQAQTKNYGQLGNAEIRRHGLESLSLFAM